MTYCVHCGKEIVLDAKYCQNCGKRLSPSVDHTAPMAMAKSDWRKVLYNVVQRITLFFVAVLALLGLVLVIINAMAFAAGKTNTGENTGILWWLIIFTYLFNRLPWSRISWKRSDFVQKHGILSGLFIAWLVVAGIYAVAMLLPRHTL